MKIIHHNDKKNKMSIITPFSIIHFLSGLIFYLVTVQILNIKFKVSFSIWFLIHLCYEMKDFHLSYIKNYDDYISNNSYINSISDQIISMLGFLSGIYFPFLSIKKLIFLIIFYTSIVLYFYNNKLG